MKRRFIGLVALVISIAMSGIASAQRRGHSSSMNSGMNNSGMSGRPATTGLDHAETKANTHGQRGIENAEEKQAAHKHSKKQKKHHHSTENRR
jgi:hypothetical protein